MRLGVMKGGGLEGVLGLAGRLESCGCMCIELEEHGQSNKQHPLGTLGYPSFIYPIPLEAFHEIVPLSLPFWAVIKLFELSSLATNRVPQKNHIKAPNPAVLCCTRSLSWQRRFQRCDSS